MCLDFIFDDFVLMLNFVATENKQELNFTFNLVVTVVCVGSFHAGSGDSNSIF